MTDANRPSHQNNDPDTVRRGQIKVLLLFLVTAGPVALATFMFFTGWGVPSTTTNKGDLVQDHPSVYESGFQDMEGESLETRFLPDNDHALWQILLVVDECDQRCEDALWTARQVHLSLNREAPRVERAFYVHRGDIPELEDHYRLTRWQSDGAPQLPDGDTPADGPLMYVIDPMGDFVLRYGDAHEGKDLLEDLRHLLKISPLGEPEE